MKNENFQDDLDWLAFRYISDELAESERDSFEQMLAEDQAAREAVACAMEQAQLMLSVFETGQAGTTGVVTSVGEEKSGYQISRRSSGRSLARTLLNLAVAILLMVGGLVWYSQVANDSSSYGTIGQVVTESGDDLEASAWVSALGQASSHPSASEFPSFDEEILYTDAVYDSSDSDSDWMLVALVELESSEESDLLGEEN